MKIPEKSHGTWKIISAYGKEDFDLPGEFIEVTIPFNWINAVENKVGSKNDARMTPNKNKILSEIINNPDVTSNQL